MNYRDYIEIMKDEQLAESELVRKVLESAMHWQKAIKNLGGYDMPIENKKELAKEFEERKIESILFALDMARFEKGIGKPVLENANTILDYIYERTIKNEA